MIDSFDDPEPDQEPFSPRSTLVRAIEGLCVAAFVAAVFVWWSDDTRMAAGRFLDGLFPPDAAPPARLAANGVRPVQAAPAAAIAEDPGRASIDPVTTGAVRPTPQAASGWVSACAGAPAASCAASQSLSEPGDPAMETSWTIEAGADGLVGIWTTPTGVMVSRGMRLHLGDGAPKTVPFDSCGPRSCEVRARLAADFIAEMKGAKSISTEIVLRGGRVVRFEFGRDGLAEALRKVGA